jgi:hypothetical protein
MANVIKGGEKENLMGLLNEILGLAATAAMNSWTSEEKETIVKARDLLKAHGFLDEAKGLDEVISKFNLGFERRSSSEGFDPDKRIQPSTTQKRPGIDIPEPVFSPAELAYELKDRLPGSFGSLDTIVSFTNGTTGSVNVKLRLITSDYARFDVAINGHLMDQHLYSTLYEREYAQAARAIITALKEIRKEVI